LNTIGGFISDIRSLLQAENIDQFVSGRLIYNIAIGEAYNLMRQKKNALNLSKDSEMVVFENCLEMVVDDSDCCNSKENVVRTKNKISTLSLPNRDGILYVTNTDSSRKYELSDTFLFASRGLNTRFGKIEGKAVFNDGYIYILGAKPKTINVAYLKSPDFAINELLNTDGCKSVLDNALPIPSDLIFYVKKATLSMILTKLNIPTDENPNLNENIKA
jgi:hypothetical protein